MEVVASVKLEENIASDACREKPRGALVPAGASAGASAVNHRILPQKAPLILFGKSKRNYETTHPPSRQFLLDFITKIVSPSPAQIAGLDAGLRSKI
jgi:hypothetical protein